MCNCEKQAICNCPSKCPCRDDEGKCSYKPGQKCIGCVNTSSCGCTEEACNCPTSCPCRDDEGNCSYKPGQMCVGCVNISCGCTA